MSFEPKYKEFAEPLEDWEFELQRAYAEIERLEHMLKQPEYMAHLAADMERAICAGAIYQNKIMREALEWYANENFGRNERARKALEAVK